MNNPLVKKTVLFLVLFFLIIAVGTGAKVPVGEWDLDEGSRQDVQDSSGEGNDGWLGQDKNDNTESYDPSWRSQSYCEEGTCLEFYDGQVVTVPHDSSLQLDNVTLAAWVYPTGFSGTRDNAILAKERQYKVALGDGSGAGEDEGELLISVYNGGWIGDDASGWDQTNYIISTNTWTHVAATYNETHFKAYVDGQLIHTDKADITSQTPIADDTYALGIGGRDPLSETANGPYYFFNGRIDNPVVYTHVLSDSEVSQLVDTNPPSTSDDYTDNEWKDTPQDVGITCSDDKSGCDYTEWRISESGRSGTLTGGDGTVSDVGQNTNGELHVEYRGIDNEGNTESWNSQRVRVDKASPSTSLSDSSTWYADDFSPSVSDSDSGGSNLDYCEYQTKDGSNAWTGWTQRSNCNQVTITVDSSSAECTTEGQDECGVRVRAVDNAGNIGAYAEESYNIDYNPLTITDDYTDNGWEPTSQDVTITCSDGSNDCVQIDWRITKGGTTVRPTSGSYNGVTDTQTTVDVGSQNNGDLTLEYRGWDQNGRSTSWQSQRVRVDKVSPTTDISDDSTWHSDDFSPSVSDSDSGGSNLNQSRCEYQVNDGNSGWSSWNTRSCDAVSVSVGSSGSEECSTQGQDECGVRTRALDNAGNSHTDTEWFNIDYEGPQTSDNYTDDEWKQSSQAIELTCQDAGSQCQSIAWRITYLNGSEIRSSTVSGSNTVVTVGSQAGGELYLHYYGTDDSGKVESPENTQRVRVDKNPPVTNITGPDPDAWYNDDITVTVTDKSSESGLGGIDLYYLADTSGSFFDEWDTLKDNIDYIESEIQSETNMDLDQNFWGLNNSYRAGAGKNAVCMPGQENRAQDIDGDGSDETVRDCKRYNDVIDDISNVGAYVNWLNAEYGSTYAANPDLPPNAFDPRSTGNGGTQPSQEAPREGWGGGMIEVIEQNNWRPNAYHAIINIADQDTNGGGGGNCGDAISQDLTNHLAQEVTAENISVFSMIGDTECNGGYPSPAHQQMQDVGEMVNYSDANELPDKIIEAMNDFNATGCEYRISGDGGNTWTSWQERGCPNGSITVPIGPSGSGAICTNEGQDMCVVQSRVEVSSGSNDIDTRRFNIDLSPPDATCDDCVKPDPVVVRKSVTFMPNVTDQYSGWNNAKICQDSSCSDPHCSFTNPDTSCDYRTDFPYGRKDFCVFTEDNIGNTGTTCDLNFTFTVLGGIGDPCTSNQQCLFGTCGQGVCKADNIPPPEIILH